MEKNIAVLGTGAIGSSIGADFALAGYNALLIDQWPAHVEAMKAHGLRVTIREEEFQVPVKAFHICELSSLKQDFDIVFLTCKSNDTRWMVELIKPYLKTDGAVVSVQNSLNDEWITPIIGEERDIACAIELSAEVFDPGIVRRNTDRATTFFALGRLDGTITPLVQEVAELLRSAGRVEISSNIFGAKWTKFILSTMGLALPAIVGMKTSELVQNRDYLDLCAKLGQETVNVGKAFGYVMEPILRLTEEDCANVTEEVLRRLLLNLVSDVGNTSRTCVIQDLLKGRTTEVEYLNGLAVKKGREVNVPTPLNEAVDSLVKRMEKGKLKPGISNLEWLY